MLLWPIICVQNIFISGNKKVVIDTWTSKEFAPELKFQLASAEANDLQSSILCETGWFFYEKNTVFLCSPLFPILN